MDTASYNGLPAATVLIPHKDDMLRIVRWRDGVLAGGIPVYPVWGTFAVPLPFSTVQDCAHRGGICCVLSAPQAESGTLVLPGSILMEGRAHPFSMRLGIRLDRYCQLPPPPQLSMRVFCLAEATGTADSWAVLRRRWVKAPAAPAPPRR